MGIKYKDVFVTMELPYADRAVYVQVHATIPMGLSEVEAEKAAAEAGVAAFVSLTGAQHPGNVFLQDLQDVENNVDNEPVPQPGLSVHWSEEEVSGIEADTLKDIREAIVEFGNNLLNEYR